MKIKKLRNIVWLLSVFTMNVGAVELVNPKITEIFESCINAGPLTPNGKNSIQLGDIIYNEWDVTLVGEGITNPNNTDTCSFTNPTAVYVNQPCQVTGVERNTFDLASIFTPLNLIAEPSVTTTNTEASPLQPGNYNSIDITGGAGTIWLAPGDYYIYELALNDSTDLQITGDTGTVNLYIQNKMIVSSSDMNHPNRLNGGQVDPDFTVAGFDPTSTTDTPNRLTIFTTAEGSNFNASFAAIVGFLYFTFDSTGSNFDIWGGVSANVFGTQNKANIYCATEYLPMVVTGPGVESIAETPLPAGWHLIGIPADTDGTVQFDQVFNEPEFLVGGIGSGAGWWAYERTFSDSNNSAWYTERIGTDTPNQSQGYWLYNLNDVNWSVAGLKPVVWELDQGVKGCTAINKCTSYTMTLPISGCAVHDNTGPLRYNYIGYPGMKDADWADFRIAVTDSGGVTTAETPGYNNYMSATIHQYNGTPETTSNTYIGCDNSGLPGSCVITPYTGFLVELNCSIVDDGVQSIELIIPNAE